MASFTGTHFILIGSTEHPDPLVRLGTAFPTLSSLSMYYSSLLNADGSPYLCDWIAAFNALSALTSFSMGSVPLNCILPSTLPSKIYSFGLGDAGITGTIPSGLLSNRTGGRPTFALGLSSNFLEGSIPPSLLSGVNLEPLYSFSLSLTNNNLTGSIPVDLFGNRSFASLTHFGIYLSNNRLDGNVGAWMTSFQPPLDGKITFFQVGLTDNQLLGP